MIKLLREKFYKDYNGSIVMKVIGYVLVGLGLVGISVSSIKSVKDIVFGFLPEAVVGVIGTSLLIGSLVVLGVGVVLLYLAGRGGGQEKEEVPIYKGKKIVGYRRV